MIKFKEYFLSEGYEQTKFGYNDDYPEAPEVVEEPRVSWKEFNRISEAIDYINESNTSLEKLYPEFLEYLSSVKFSVEEIEGESNWCKVSNKKDSYYIFNDNNSNLTLFTKEEFIDTLNQDLNSFERNYLEREYDNFYTEDFGFISDWMKNPEGTYYHYTTLEKWNKIQAKGYMFSSSGTGLYNRHQKGIFTSTEPEEYATGTYGDVLLEIDMTTFLKDGNKSSADIEEPYREYEKMKYIASVFELEWEPHMENDYSMHTAILQPEKGIIPIKYIKRRE